MPKPYDFGSVELDVTPRERKSALALDPETPFRMLVMGDFTGRANRGIVEKVAGRRPVLVDRDNLDGLLGRMGASLELPLTGGGSLALKFRELEDFHPERIYAGTEVFAALKKMREKLEDPATFRATAAQLRAPRQEQAVSDVLSGSLLDQVVEQAEAGGAAAPLRRADPLASYVRALVEPHLVPKPDARQSEMVAQVEQATAAALRAILHHPDFQALEAAWRGLDFLARGVETDELLKLYILDVSLAELAADFGSADDLASTGIYKLLVEQTVLTPGAMPWAVLAGDYTFDDGLVSVELLCRIALIASKAGAPFLAAAGSKVAGCKSFGETPDPDDWTRARSEAWSFVREFPEARYLGLALPRILLRLPYGKSTSPVEAFPFEELPERRHEAYLWGNPVFACLTLIGQAFSEFGWDMRPGMRAEIGGMPVHIYKDAGGDPQMQACAEALLTERATERLLELGLIPVVSFKAQDRIRVAGFHSLATPPQPLAGRW
ncbi:MAG: type VI secretion system contractile sheath large subunit [Acidobacteria bacterium]|nr:type VI secretion system contractile sheath large subunit [Acidobacteriota bacterium]